MTMLGVELNEAVSMKELALPRLVRCKLIRVRCHTHSLLLLSIVHLPMQDEKEEAPAVMNCRI